MGEIKVKNIKNKLQQGFTLIEVMVVVVILAILAAILVPRIMNRPEQARMVKAKTDLMAIQNALEMYKLDNGFYPSTEQGIQALVTKPEGDPQPQDWQGYLKTTPQDPWGHQYQYSNPGKHGDIDIWSTGKQGTAENIIGNWAVK